MRKTRMQKRECERRQLERMNEDDEKTKERSGRKESRAMNEEDDET